MMDMTGTVSDGGGGGNLTWFRMAITDLPSPAWLCILPLTAWV